MNALRAVVLGAVLCSSAAVALAQAPAPAAWREHEFDFTYMGFTTRYSCDGLRHKVGLILGALGAREHPQIRATGCEFRGGVAVAPRVHVRVALPVSATAEDGTFTAEPGTITLAANRPHGLAAGDCELVEQLRERVFPDLGVEVVAGRTGCVPHQLGVGRPVLEARVLRAVER